jgi:hypothetical protein
MALCASAVLLTLVACSAPMSSSGADSGAGAKPSGAITESEVRRLLGALSDDSLEGRMTASRGSARAAAIIAAEMRRIGLEPAGDSGYFQRVPIALSGRRPVLLESFAQLDTLPAAQRPPSVNVVGVLRGSDPAVRDSAVLIDAHYDHLGIGRPVNGDSIYNGADDDGSGTAAVMAIAEAFGRGPRPRRSMLFIWHTGEERQRWGSSYFVQHPTVPLAQIVAALNIDMIGRTRTAGTDSTKWTVVRPGELYVIGSRRMSRELGEINEAVNRSYLRLALNYRFDALDDPSQLFSRSDQYSYAEKGIPVIFYYGGEHEDYHRPSDTADKIDYQHLQAVARTVYATAWELANRAKRPRVDKSPP